MNAGEVIVSVEKFASLADAEGAIVDYAHSRKRAAQALRDIVEHELWRQGDRDYLSFDDYCEARWGLTSSRVRQLVREAKFDRFCAGTNVPAPANEAQYRALASTIKKRRIEDDDSLLKRRAHAWQIVVEQAACEPITAKFVEATVDHFLGTGHAKKTPKRIAGSPKPSHGDLTAEQRKTAAEVRRSHSATQQNGKRDRLNAILAACEKVTAFDPDDAVDAHGRLLIGNSRFKALVDWIERAQARSTERANETVRAALPQQRRDHEND